MPAPLVMLPVRARRAVARPIVRRLVVAGLALTTAVCVASVVDAATAARERWGTTRPVAVATRDLAPGDLVDEGAAAVRDLPVAVVPDAAIAEPPVGATVRQAIPAGEPLVADRLAPQGLTGAAALVPAGHRAVAVPVGPAGRPPLVVGDAVDVVVVLPADLSTAVTAGPEPGRADTPDATDTPDAAEAAEERDPTGALEGPAADPAANAAADVVADPDEGDPAFPLVERATVVDVGEQAVTVAVPEGDASRVAWAVANGAVVLTLTGA